MKRLRILSAVLAVLFSFSFTSCGSNNDSSEEKTNQTDATNMESGFEADESNAKSENDIVGKWHKVSSMVVDGEKYKGPDDPNMITCTFRDDQTLSFNTDYDDDTFRFLSGEFSTWVYGSWGSPTTDENGDFVYPLFCDGNQFGSATLDKEPEGGLTISLFWRNDILYFDTYDCKITED